jgi:hypothetical protein
MCWLFELLPRVEGFGGNGKPLPRDLPTSSGLSNSAARAVGADEERGCETKGRLNTVSALSCGITCFEAGSFLSSFAGQPTGLRLTIGPGAGRDMAESPLVLLNGEIGNFPGMPSGVDTSSRSAAGTLGFWYPDLGPELWLYFPDVNRGGVRSGRPA